MQRQTRMMIAIGGTALIAITLGGLWLNTAREQISTAFKQAPENEKEIIDIGKAFGELGKGWRPTTAQPVILAPQQPLATSTYGTPQTNPQ